MKKANLVVKNAEIYSVNKKNNLIVSQAMAVSGDKIVYVGSDKEVETYIASDTRVIDMAGKTVLPGLGDAHLHASMTTEQLSDVYLYDIRCDEEYNRDELIGKLRAAIKEGAK